jgi:hypothetical protein
MKRKGRILLGKIEMDIVAKRYSRYRRREIPGNAVIRSPLTMGILRIPIIYLGTVFPNGMILYIVLSTGMETPP